LRGSEVPELAVASGDRIFLVTRYDDCRAVLGDARFSRNIGRPEAARLIPGVRMPSQPLADPPLHTTWRRQLARSFTARRVESLRPRVEQIVRERLDDLEGAGPPADLMEHLAFPVPILVICALLDLEPHEHAPFRSLASVALATEASTPEAKGAAFGGLAALAGDIVDTRRESPGTDLLSEMIGADDASLTREELVATVMTLLIGGYENPAHQIGKSFYALFRHPDQLAMLVADPALVPAAVEETLRYVGALDSGFGSPRYALEDVVVSGTRIPAGATVIVNRQAANRDHRRFDDAGRLDLTRATTAHLTFGFGAHHCIGAALARLEFEVLLSRTLERLPRLRSHVAVTDVPWAYRVTASGPETLLVDWS